MGIIIVIMFIVFLNQSPKGCVIDQNQNGMEAFGVLYGLKYQAQTFTPTTRGLNIITLNLKKIGNNGDLDILITTTNNGLPTTTILSESIIDASILTTDFVDYNINIPTTLVRGVQYAIVLKSPNSINPSNDVLFRFSTNNFYADGVSIYSNDGGLNWGKNEGYDMYFKTWSCGVN